MSILTDKIKAGEIDINNQQNFFSSLIKAFILDLSGYLSIRDNKIPHFILNSGDDIMYLENKGQDFSIEPLQVSNEDFIYGQIPRAIIEVGGVNLVGDQLTNPYTRGNLEIEYDNQLHALTAEFRRVPIIISITTKYYLDSYLDSLELIQKLIQALAFVKTFKFVYMGKVISASYKLPESFDAEKNIQIDGGTTDSKFKTVQLDFEIESNYPVFEGRTVIDSGNVIRTVIHDLHTPDDNKITNIIE